MDGSHSNRQFRVTLAQLNPTLGAFEENAKKAEAAYSKGCGDGADVVMLPEMFLTGYQVQDIVMRPAFYTQARKSMEELAKVTAGKSTTLCVGAPVFDEGHLFNGYYVLQNGQIETVLKKHDLPNFNVFDEKRHYTPGGLSDPIMINGVSVGIPICEDAWHPEVCGHLAEAGAELLCVPNGSPYFRGKFKRRVLEMSARVQETGLPLTYLNMVGGQDDQVFDGGSFAMDVSGAFSTQMPLFDEAIETVIFEDLDGDWVALPGEKAEIPSEIEQDYRVMVDGLRDYLGKTGFSKVLLGLSGGIDSALVATIAVDALGPGNVRCVMLPSEYTSQGSLDDAAACANALGARLDQISISEPRAAVSTVLAPFFDGTDPGIAEENIQSRLRGLLLMGLSNKFGEMLLTTGNKSEVAVGYATIYGDMSGGYNPIKDMYKMRVFETCRWRNVTHRVWMNGPAGEMVPQTIIEKPPSAELREDQKDEDSLPPYEVLDAILERLVDHDCAIEDIVSDGFDRETVKKVEHLVYISEYKRFQSAPGPRLTQKSFWLDRRYPIVNRWRDSS
ncbi:MAG: NAD+ synthase [Pseudomonadota bacterium]